MNIEHLISELESQRDRVTQAIEALNGNRRRPGRPRATASTGRIGPRRRRRMSTAARKRISLAAKKRWAKAKAAGKKSLAS